MLCKKLPHVLLVKQQASNDWYDTLYPESPPPPSTPVHPPTLKLFFACLLLSLSCFLRQEWFAISNECPVETCSHECKPRMPGDLTRAAGASGSCFDHAVVAASRGWAVDSKLRVSTRNVDVAMRSNTSKVFWWAVLDILNFVMRWSFGSRFCGWPRASVRRCVRSLVAPPWSAAFIECGVVVCAPAIGRVRCGRCQVPRLTN